MIYGLIKVMIVSQVVIFIYKMYIFWSSVYRQYNDILVSNESVYNTEPKHVIDSSVLKFMKTSIIPLRDNFLIFCEILKFFLWLNEYNQSC